MHIYTHVGVTEIRGGGGIFLSVHTIFSLFVSGAGHTHSIHWAQRSQFCPNHVSLKDEIRAIRPAQPSHQLPTLFFKARSLSEPGVY